MYTGCSRLARKLTLATVTASARLILFAVHKFYTHSVQSCTDCKDRTPHCVAGRSCSPLRRKRALTGTQPTVANQKVRCQPAKTDTEPPESESSLPRGIEFHCDRIGTTDWLCFSLGPAVAESRTKCYEGPGTRRPSQNRGTAP